MKLSESLWGIRCVWLRYFDVFRKSFFYYLVTTFTEPILYLLSFGLGVGSLVGKIHYHGQPIDYRSFIFSGIIGQTVLFQGFFEASYGGFIRMYYQKIFQAMSVTPITLSEVLWGELLWDASKSTLAAEAVVLIGVITGDFPAYSLITVLPVLMLSSFLFSGMGLAVAAYSRTIEQISYPQYLLVFPMFLFCGVFYPIDTLPDSIQIVAWALPLTSVNSLIRSLTLGFPLEWKCIPLLAVWLFSLTYISRRSMTRRLIK
jgi:lipooligosaccharide transport system permease protein